MPGRTQVAGWNEETGIASFGYSPLVRPACLLIVKPHTSYSPCPLLIPPGAIRLETRESA
jgi:hypothetical protein